LRRSAAWATGRVAELLKSFRSRLIATVIGLIAVTAGLVAVSSYALVRNSLRSQLVEDSVARTEFNITVLATPDQLPPDASASEFEASGLTDRFLLRGSSGVFVEFADNDTFSSSLGLVAADELVSAELQALVAGGNYGYEFIDLDGDPTLVVGGRRPPTGPDFYFFYPADSVDNALSQVARVLVAVSAFVLLVGALVAGLIARRVLRPVAVVGEAAGLMAQGDFGVRLPADTNDELGKLAVAFNEMAASLEQQIAALVAAHSRERRFVADVSHELRTPLTALVNEAARLQPSLAGLSEIDRRVGGMLVADVARLRKLVEDLLEVSRPESARTSNESLVDLPGFLEAVVADRHPAAELRTDHSIGMVRLDGRSLERIIGNLLDNARNHAPDARVDVVTGLDSNGLQIAVADRGPGVPEAELPHLFDRFYKTDSSRQGGSGLGLAIARQHAERLGGSLVVRNANPHGLVFELRLPVTESLHPGDLDEISVTDPDDVDPSHFGSKS
jgi:signal transduction histidine kinase